MSHGIAHHPQPLPASASMMPVLCMRRLWIIAKHRVLGPMIDIAIRKIRNLIRGVTAIYEFGEIPDPAIGARDPQHLYVTNGATVSAPYPFRPFDIHDGIVQVSISHSDHVADHERWYARSTIHSPAWP